MTVLENDFMKVAIQTKGAELSSLFNKISGVEQLWQGDATIWPWHAPNLFPVIGGLINDELLADGKSYTMHRHGFARQSEFLVINSDDRHAKFSLSYFDGTLTVYPYKFDFQVHYDLIDNALRITYKVVNHDRRSIYFSVGGHPAFNVPFHPSEDYEDYYIEFELEEKLETHTLSPEGFFNNLTRAVPVEGKKLYLKRDMFLSDALIFKDLKSREVCIKSNLHEESLSVEFPHFNYLGIWAKPGADFLCIEPWLGCADTAGQHLDITKKEGIQTLRKGHVFEEAFFISI